MMTFRLHVNLIYSNHQTMHAIIFQIIALIPRMKITLEPFRESLANALPNPFV